MKKLVSILMGTMLLVSCSKVKELDERTESMTKTTEEMSGTTEDMKKSTNTLLKLQRQYSTADLRTKQSSRLDSKMTDMGDKLIAAKKMMLGYEYQLWNPSNEFDTIEYREHLLHDAVKEFMYKVSGLHDKLLEKNFWGKTKLERMSPLNLKQDRKGRNKNNIEMIFYALGTSMHFNNVFQEKMIEELNDSRMEEISMYDLVKTALIKDFENDQLTVAEQEVVTGEFRQAAIDLLKARYNMLIALAVKNLSTQKGMKFGDKVNALIFKATKGGLGKLKLYSIFEESNLPTQKDINKKLEGAIKTRKVLYAIGENVKIDKNLKSVLSNLVIDETTEVTDEITQFLTYINVLNAED
jgi:hypothetical protein